MKFDYNIALANPGRLRIRGTEVISIIDGPFQGGGALGVIVHTSTGRALRTYNREGEDLAGLPALQIAPVVTTRWINIYKTCNGVTAGEVLYKTEKLARASNTYTVDVLTAKVEWEDL